MPDKHTQMVLSLQPANREFQLPRHMVISAEASFETGDRGESPANHPDADAQKVSIPEGTKNDSRGIEKMQNKIDEMIEKCAREASLTTQDIIPIFDGIAVDNPKSADYEHDQRIMERKVPPMIFDRSFDFQAREERFAE